MTEIPNVEAQGVISDALALVKKTQSIVVQTPEQFQSAGADRVALKAAEKRLETTRVLMTKPILDAKRNIDEMFRPSLEEVAERIKAVDVAMLTFKREQDRVAAAERARLQREADAAAEAERRQLAEDAEKARAEGRVLAAAVAERKADEVVAPTVSVVVPVVKAEGVSTRKSWTYRIVDEQLIPREFLQVDDRKIGAVARATKGAVQIPGVEIYAEELLVNR